MILRLIVLCLGFRSQKVGASLSPCALFGKCIGNPSTNHPKSMFQLSGVQNMARAVEVSGFGFAGARVFYPALFRALGVDKGSFDCLGPQRLFEAMLLRLCKGVIFQLRASAEKVFSAFGVGAVPV